ncbi:MAG TPA: MOSC domain-containing protein, partial [Anaerolineae bacterium]|nr:MOSC domain-containing protein [Anaerolineae bacterium]
MNENGDYRATMEMLEAGEEMVKGAPKKRGEVVMIVRRPDLGEREVVAEGVLSCAVGLVGDNWLARGSRHTADGTAERGKQLTLMSSRVAALVAGERGRWPLAGDQLYVDLDLSEANLPAGARLRVGTAVVEVSVLPHTGCKKFRERFGLDALKWVSSAEGKG